mmetsp:Transcript_113105/g.259213  ORF Transcript_113105/g.259213 Transcript_113105/m.259213 type:complete len:95 (-) Transcript_113105:1108-1392(-)
MVADGDISTDEQERMKNRVRELMATMKRLTAAYTDKRSEAGLDPLDLDLLEEDFFMYNLAQMTQALARTRCWTLLTLTCPETTGILSCEAIVLT